MIELPENETYTIRTIEDLMNCPVNMQIELINVLSDFFIKRNDLIEKTGNDQIAKNITFSLTNDGVIKSNVKIKRTKKGL